MERRRLSRGASRSVHDIPGRLHFRGQPIRVQPECVRCGHIIPLESDRQFDDIVEGTEIAPGQTAIRHDPGAPGVTINGEVHGLGEIRLLRGDNLRMAFEHYVIEHAANRSRWSMRHDRLDPWRTNP